MHINLHIERLILEGLPIERSQAALVQAAVEAELSQLLASSGLSATLLAGGTLPRLSVPTIALRGTESPAQIGAQIAQAVYGGIGNE